MAIAEASVTTDNERVRVTRWSFEPGERTGPHRHEYAYVVVPVTGGQLRLESSDGIAEATQVQGESYYREAGAEHDVVNAGDAPLVFVEIELKAGTDHVGAGDRGQVQD